MKKKLKTIDQVKTAGNDGKNQDIKNKFIQQHVYCNVDSLVEYCLSKDEDTESPINYDSIENYYSYPEWAQTVLGVELSFLGGNESDKNTFLENFDRLRDDNETLYEDETISEHTYDRNNSLIDKALREFNELDTESQEIYEWWAVSDYLFDKLKDKGYPVVDAGSCYVWGRITNQAILLDYVITEICAEMGILEGQENAWL